MRTGQAGVPDAPNRGSETSCSGFDSVKLTSVLGLRGCFRQPAKRALSVSYERNGAPLVSEARSSSSVARWNMLFAAAAAAAAGAP